MNRESDEDLVNRYRAEGGSPGGDPYLDQLFQRHHGRVAAWCFRMTGDVDLASDLAQEVFIKVFQGLDNFRGGAKFTTWIYVIARNCCMDELKARSNRGEQAGEGVLEELADARIEEVSATLERREAEELLRRLMRESLEEIEMKVMTLHYFQEVPLEAIGRQLQLTNTSGAKAHIVSAKRKLGRALERWQARGQAKKGEGHAE